MNTINDPITDLRNQVDELDAELIALLARRQQLTDAIGHEKKSLDAVPAYDRLLPMLSERAARASHVGLDGDFIARVFEQFALHSMARQRAHLALTPKITSLPLVYSCSGCSSAAQLANDMALALDRESQAEMSCISGVGAGIRSLTNKARRGIKRIVIDGCPKACARHCLENQGLIVDAHVELSALGVRKLAHQHYSVNESIMVRTHLKSVLENLTQSDIPS